MPEVITEARGSEAWSSLGRARYVRCGSRSEAKDPRGGGEVRPCVARKQQMSIKAVKAEKGKYLTILTRKYLNMS